MMHLVHTFLDNMLAIWFGCVIMWIITFFDHEQRAPENSYGIGFIWLLWMFMMFSSPWLE